MKGNYKVGSVNQYQYEKSPSICTIIISGRAMKTPFNGLKLLDYRISSTSVFSNVALKKHGKIVLIFFKENRNIYTSGEQIHVL